MILKGVLRVFEGCCRVLKKYEQMSLPDSENMMGHHYNGRTPAVEGHRTGE